MRNIVNRALQGNIFKCAERVRVYIYSLLPSSTRDIVILAWKRLPLLPFISVICSINRLPGSSAAIYTASFTLYIMYIEDEGELTDSLEKEAREWENSVKKRGSGISNYSIYYRLCFRFNHVKFRCKSIYLYTNIRRAAGLAGRENAQLVSRPVARIINEKSAASRLRYIYIQHARFHPWQGALSLSTNRLALYIHHSRELPTNNRTRIISAWSCCSLYCHGGLHCIRIYTKNIFKLYDVEV